MTMHPGQKEIEQLVYRELANEPMTAEDMELKKHIMNCEKCRPYYGVYYLSLIHICRLRIPGSYDQRISVRQADGRQQRQRRRIKKID